MARICQWEERRDTDEGDFHCEAPAFRTVITQYEGASHGTADYCAAHVAIALTEPNTRIMTEDD